MLGDVPTGAYGGLREPTGAYGSLLGPTGAYGSLRKPTVCLEVPECILEVPDGAYWSLKLSEI